MRLSRVFFVGVALLVARPCVGAEAVKQVWRSAFGTPRSAAVNPTDSSVWAATGSSVMHLAADATVLSQTDGFWSPNSVSVNAADGSCWVADTYNDQVVHLSAAGLELWRGGGFSSPCSVSVNSSDGSCWVGDTSNNQVVHLSAAGDELWRGGGFGHPCSVSVNPSDGSCWVADCADWTGWTRISPPTWRISPPPERSYGEERTSWRPIPSP